MAIKSRLPIPLPHKSSYELPLRETSSVGGNFTVTATLNKLEDILEWQEGHCEFEYGYYRFIDHPALVKIQEGLRQHYQVHHCLVYASFKTAVMEVLDYLLLAKPQMTVKIVSDLDEHSPFSIKNSLSGLRTNLNYTSPDRLAVLEPFSKNKDELLVIAVREPLEFIGTHMEFLENLKKLRVSVTVISDHFPQDHWPEKLIKFWVLPLNTDPGSIQGGAVLSSADRQIAELKELRKQRGPILSSRNAAYFLGETFAFSMADEEKLIRYFCDLEHARYGFLFASGMQAIAVLLSMLRKPNKAQVVVIGLLYTDTYALLTYGKQRSGPVENVFLTMEEVDQLEQVISEETALIITETITNPLNSVPDLDKIARVAKAHDIPLVVDNTIATPLNCNPLVLGADYVVHSTTKFFNGANDHGGGLIVLNDVSAAERIQTYQHQWDNGLSPLEGTVLWGHIQDFETRMERFHTNALQVAEFLQQHPAVEKVYFNSIPTHRTYATAQRLLKGVGSLLSYTLKENTLEGLRKFYDADLSPIIKAPSLGSDQTLLCPYTLLAHYHEPEEQLAELGLPRYLIRIAVGSETNIRPVIEALDQALNGIR